MQNRIIASIIIPTYDRRETLAAALSALERQEGCDFAFEVIVVDDGSRDATAEMVEQTAATVSYPLRCVRVSRCGPGLARNRGVEAAAGDAVLFTDSDCVPRPGWVAALVRAVQEADGPVGGPTAVPARASWSARCVNAIMNSRLGGLGRQWRLLGLWAGYRLRTCNAGLLREQFNAVGGFSSVCGFYGEDIELSERLSRRFGQPRRCDSAVVEHRENRRLGDYVREAAAKGICTGRLVRKRRLKLKGVYLVPTLLIALASGGVLLPVWHRGPAMACGGLLAAYLAAVLAYGVAFAVRERRLTNVLLLPLTAVLIHGSFGLGFPAGLLGRRIPVKESRGPARPTDPSPCILPDTETNRAG